MPFFQGVAHRQADFTVSCIIPLGTQQQLTHPPVKISTFLLRKMPVFQGVAHRQINFTLSLSETQQQLTHPPVKSSILPLRKMPVFQGVSPWHTIFTSSYAIPIWVSATAHSLSGKELILSSLEESCFSGLIVLLMFSHYPARALFGLLLTHITY